MPHLILASYTPPPVGAQAGRTTFQWRALGPRRELWSMGRAGRDYLLALAPHAQGYILKSDKLTRTSDIETLKEVMRDFAVLTQARIVGDNTTPKSRPRPAPLEIGFDEGCRRRGWPEKVALEIGFGSGRHLLWRARQESERLFIGVEIHKPSLHQLLKQCQLQGIENVRAVDYDANLFLETLPDALLDAIYVHFPIPWSKSPGRNVFCRQLVREARRVLKPGGTLELRTDDAWYVEWALEVLAGEPELTFTVEKNRALEIVSKYEARWLRQGKEITDITVTNTAPLAGSRPEGAMRFPEGLTWERVCALASGQSVVETGWLLKFGSVYTIGADEGLVSVIMGSPMRPETRYLLFKEGRLEYYPAPPVCTQAGWSAHQTIVERLS